MRSYFQEQNGNFNFTDRLKGTVILEGTASNILPLHKQDTIRSYYRKNVPKSVAVYENNKLISNENWLKNGSKYFSDIHYFVDEVPEHSNGQAHFRAYILNGIRESGIDLNQIADRVIIGWVIMENGELTGFHTISGVYSLLNNTLIKLLREMPGEWIPAKNNGQAVRYYMDMPFNFIDNSEGFESLDLSTGFLVWD
ncbi:MAG: hypothetical protein PF450_04965 [Bacteroidales bacterium]|jgi:hypothetical protein|nr:hypothetical protein [Bacteroidales bacterium]